MMLKGEDGYILQTLLNTNTITDEDQLIPACALQAIQTTIKEDEHHWHYRDEIFSDIRQQPDQGIHTLHTKITNLVNNCKFTDAATKETIKIILLIHSVTFHEARDWIRLQDQSALTYQSLLQHCKLLELQCGQYRKTQLKGKAQVTTPSTATATHSSIHQDAITVNSTCHRCRYSHLRGNCPTIGQRCHNCNRIGHFSALCRSRNTKYTNNYRKSRANWEKTIIQQQILKCRK